MSKNQMTSYERVVTSLRHQEPDRVPFDLGGSMVTGININALNRLRPALGLSGAGQVKDRVTQMAHTGADVEAILGTDVTNVGPFPPVCAGLARDVGHEEGHDRLIDEFGIGWQMPLTGGHYYDLYHSPLAAVETPQQVEKYPGPIRSIRPAMRSSRNVSTAPFWRSRRAWSSGV